MRFTGASPSLRDGIQSGLKLLSDGICFYAGVSQQDAPCTTEPFLFELTVPAIQENPAPSAVSGDVQVKSVTVGVPTDGFQRCNRACRKPMDLASHVVAPISAPTIIADLGERQQMAENVGEELIPMPLLLARTFANTSEAKRSVSQGTCQPLRVASDTSPAGRNRTSPMIRRP